MAFQIVAPADATVGWNVATDRNEQGGVFTTVTLKLAGTGVELVTDRGVLLADVTLGKVVTNG